MKKKLFLILLVLVFFALALALPRMKFCLIRADGGGGDLLWRDDEAYLFMFDRPFGYHLSGADLLAEPIKEYFHSPAIPENDSYAITIVHITSSAVDRHVQKSTIGIHSFTPLGNAIYAVCPGGICKWNGAQFELITGEEEQQIGGRDRLIDDRKEFTDLNGWSRRLIWPDRPRGTPVRGRYSIEVGKQFTLLVTEGNPALVYLQRPNQREETLWYYKRGLSVVSKAKYERVFGLPQTCGN